jgi:plastocyanin
MTLGIAALVAAGALLGAAQEATPGSGATHAHPAHIHLGTCAELDPNPTFPLTDITLNSPEPAGETAEGAAIPVERSVTTVEATLEELRAGGYAINVHQSVEEIGTYIACGSLSGTPDDRGLLVVGLGDLNESGHSGVASLAEQGGQTEVTVYLLAEGTGATEAAANASPGDVAEAAAAAVAVDIRDFAYTPDPVEIPVGATITWTNSDAAPHTATAPERAVLQSGTLQQGESFSQTFAESGTFDYFCEFHPNMKGTIVVQ